MSAILGFKFADVEFMLPLSEVEVECDILNLYLNTYTEGIAIANGVVLISLAFPPYIFLAQWFHKSC